MTMLITNVILETASATQNQNIVMFEISSNI